MRLQMRLRSLASPGRAHDLGLCIAWSEMAEDARFELARGCPQHAFQQCWPPFTNGRYRPWPADSLGPVAGERRRTPVNETRTETRPVSRNPAQILCAAARR